MKLLVSLLVLAAVLALADYVPPIENDGPIGNGNPCSCYDCHTIGPPGSPPAHFQDGAGPWYCPWPVDPPAMVR